MTIEQMIKNAMASMIERKLSLKGVEVSSWEEEIERSWFQGCDTCGHGADEDEYTVCIIYIRDGKRRYYTHKGTFAELIRELDTDV